MSPHKFLTKQQQTGNPKSIRIVLHTSQPFTATNVTRTQREWQRIHKRIGATYYLHLQVRSLSQVTAKDKPETGGNERDWTTD
jgi:hypothetical protein